VSLVPENVSTGITNPSKNKWLLAHKQSQLVKLTFTDCICFSNLNGDGEYRLVIADLGDRLSPTSASGAKGSVHSRLLILRGTSVQSELSLPEIPVGVISFSLQGTSEHTGEVLAVAAGSCVYVYKNLKPFYKFALPPAPNNVREVELWQQTWTKQLTPIALRDQLLQLQSTVGRQALSYVSQILLDVQSDDQCEPYVRETLERVTDDNGLNALLIKANIITCFGRLRKTGGDLPDDICLLLGTEHCQLLVVEPHAFTVLQCYTLAAAPVFVRSSGAFEVDFRLLILCRDSQVYVLRRGWAAPRLAIQLTTQPIALVRHSSNVLVGCMNQVLSAHTAKAACLWSIRLPAPICSMISIHIQPLGVRLVAVALRSGDLLFFSERNLVDQMRTDSPVVAMQFGHFGREEHTLVLVTQTGDVLIHILKRTAKFFNMDPISAGCGVTSGAFTGISGSSTLLNSTLPTAAPLHIPKKTKLFVDQTVHERENALSNYFFSCYS
jgi:Bardet-Biedl syndrome 1 protein